MQSYCNFVFIDDFCAKKLLFLVPLKGESESLNMWTLINQKSFNVKFWIPLNWAKLNKMAERYVIIELSLSQPIIFRCPYII